MFTKAMLNCELIKEREIIDLAKTNLTWKTKEGLVIPIRFISNKHQVNIILYEIERIKQLNDLYNRYYYFEEIIYGIEDMIFKSMWWLELMQNLALYRIENSINITEEDNVYYMETMYDPDFDVDVEWMEM